jgi:aspartate dehydrogenase
LPGIKKIKVGIVGCGAIGSGLAKAITLKFKKEAQLVALCDINKDKARKLAGSLKVKIEAVSLDSLIKKSDFIIEAASKEISATVAKKAIVKGKDVLIMSVGGLLKNLQLFRLARKNNCKIYIPSGALCGIDGVKAASIGRISKVTLTSKKPPAGFSNAPYVIKNKINLNFLNKETLIFEGSAEEAVEGFPQNINVAAVLSLAGIGAKNTKVKIIASPGKNVNSHEIEAEGEFGRLIARTDNIPSPGNPKTSYLAILSAMATLKNVFSPVKIGT